MIQLSTAWRLNPNDSQAHHERLNVGGFAVENSLKPVEKGPLFPQALALISPSNDCVSFATH